MQEGRSIHAGASVLVQILRRNLHRASDSMFEMLFNNKFLQRRLAFEMRFRHYQDLGISVPLSKDIQCPIYAPGYWWSFNEIFLSDEYRTLLEHVPMPRRWLDLGCHAGFFSLWIIWQRACQNLSSEFQALLVDADSRVAKAIDRLVSVNRLQGRLRFRHGAISEQDGQVLFVERDCMSSSEAADLNDRLHTNRKVPVITACDLLKDLPAPYDLVKIDVEGSEYDFLKAYEPVLAVTNYLLLEWHGWHKGGGGSRQIEQLAAKAGFELVADKPNCRPMANEDENNECGVMLFQRNLKAALEPCSATAQSLSVT